MASMAVNEIGPLLTASEVADMLHLHVNTVKRLGDRGELPFYRVCKRGDRRFRLDDVPPGAYELVAWHAPVVTGVKDGKVVVTGAAEVRRQVVVKPLAPTTLSLDLPSVR